MARAGRFKVVHKGNTQRDIKSLILMLGVVETERNVGAAAVWDDHGQVFIGQFHDNFHFSVAFWPHHDVWNSLEFSESKNVKVSRCLSSAPKEPVVEVQRVIDVRIFKFFAECFVLKTRWIVTLLVHWIDVRLEVQNIDVQQLLEQRTSSGKRYARIDRISVRDELETKCFLRENRDNLCKNHQTGLRRTHVYDHYVTMSLQYDHQNLFEFRMIA